jgi:hypothetical protein
MDASQKLQEELAKLARQVDVSTHYLRAMLDFPLPSCATTSIAEAETAYLTEEEGSEAKQAAYLQLIKLLQSAVGNASTLVEISAIWQKASGLGLSKVEKPALIKWISLASNIEELKLILERLPPYSEEAQKVVDKMWNLHRATATT